MSLTYNYKATITGRFGLGTMTGNTGQLLDISGSIYSQSRTENFNYDNVGRLSTWQGWSPSLQGRYSYDQWNNRLGVWNATSGGTQIQGVTLAQSPSGYPVSNQYTTVTNNGVTLNQGYDASGNLTSDGVHNYVYDAESRLVTVDEGLASEADYSYDLNNWRVKRTTGAGSVTTYYVWSGGQVIAEYSNAAPTATSAVMYYHPDQLSTRLITGATGSVLATEDVLPFGEDAGTSSGVTDKHRFTDYERDSETGLDYATNRHYVSANGRFMQPDVVGGSTFAPQSLNRYSYSLNDPKNLSDPSGLQYVDGGPDGPPPDSPYGPGPPWGPSWTPYLWNPSDGPILPFTRNLSWGPPDEFDSPMINAAMAAYSGGQSTGQPWYRSIIGTGPLWNNARQDYQGRAIYVIQQIIANASYVAWFNERLAHTGHPTDLVQLFTRTGFNFFLQDDSVSLAGLEGLDTKYFGIGDGFGQTLFRGSANPQVVINRSAFASLSNEDIATQTVHEMAHAAGLHGSAPTPSFWGPTTPNDLNPEIQWAEIRDHCGKGVK